MVPSIEEIFTLLAKLFTSFYGLYFSHHIRMGAFKSDFKFRFFLEKSSPLLGCEPMTPLVRSQCVTNEAIQA